MNRDRHRTQQNKEMKIITDHHTKKNTMPFFFLLILLFLLVLAWNRVTPSEEPFDVQRNQWTLKTDQKTSRSFAVLPTKDPEQASSLLGQITDRVNQLLVHLQQTYPRHLGVKRLVDRWNPQVLAEGRFDLPGVTSYTVNKGDRIVLCLRNRQGELHRLQLVLYVLLHELAHIMSVTKSVERHNEEFQQNLDLLMKEAQAIQLYEPNHEKRTETYCGLPGVQIP
jgi:hypothetical protein